MKKTIVLVLMLMCVFALSACSKKEEVGIEDLDICGSWKKERSGEVQIFTFNEDMTYNEYIRLESYGVVTENESSDKYELNGDEITIHYSKYGKKSTYKIVIEGDKMTWTYVENNSVIEYTKVN